MTAVLLRIYGTHCLHHQLLRRSHRRSVGRQYRAIRHELQQRGRQQLCPRIGTLHRFLTHRNPVRTTFEHANDIAQCAIGETRTRHTESLLLLPQSIHHVVVEEGVAVEQLRRNAHGGRASASWCTTVQRR